MTQEKLKKESELNRSNEDGLIVYTNEELAKKLSVCKRTLQNYRDNGVITFSQVGRKIYYTNANIAAFLNNYTQSKFN